MTRTVPALAGILLLAGGVLAALVSACGHELADPLGGEKPDTSDGVRLSAQALPGDLQSLGTVEVTWVSDGDTMNVVTAQGDVVTIRFYGVDTPESDQPSGSAARDYVRGLLGGAAVEVRLLPGEVTYGRKVGIVLADDVVVNAALLDAGWAWFYAAYCDRPLCDGWEALADAARAARRGLWAADDPIAPWEWRRSR